MKKKPVPVPELASDPRVLKILQEAMQRAAEVKGDETRFQVYQGRELQFILDVFGIGAWSEVYPDRMGLTPDQVGFFTDIFKYRRLSVRSGHGTGKSFVLALAALTYAYVWLGRVIITASTWKQVEDVVYAEILRLFRNARVPLPCKEGHPLQTPELRINDDIYIVGLSVNDPTAFQGRHFGRMLVIVDEAVGVDNPTHQAIRSLCTGVENRIAMVANPTTVTGEFYDSFRSRTWHNRHMSCLNHPNVVTGRESIPGAVTTEWVEEQREQYGEDSPIWQSRVLGEFPTMTSNAVVPVVWIEQGMDQAQYAAALGGLVDGLDVPVWALDVSRYGDARTVLIERSGYTVTQITDWAHVATTVTAGTVFDAYMKAREGRRAPSVVIVDESGVGGPVLDRLIELGVPAVGYHSGRPAAARSLFGNRRAEDYWRIRQLLEKNTLRLPRHQALHNDLTNVTYRVPLGKIYITSKEEMIAQRIKSPDFADALVMCLAMEGDVLPDTSRVHELEVQDDMDVPQYAPRDDNGAESALGFSEALGAGW